MKKGLIVVYTLLIAAVLGLLGYELIAEKNFDTGFLLKAILCLLGLIAAMVKNIVSPRRQVSNKKTLYQKAYSEYIQSAFSDDKKLEKRFYKAVDDYNKNKPAAAVAKLEKLRKECMRTSDLRAVTVFTALCLDDMQLYDKAIVQYDAALRIRDNSSLHSNMGLCCQRLGRFEEAEQCYDRAIKSDPKNAYAYNNLSALYFRLGNYDEALDLAAQTVEIDPKMPQALNTAAVCSGLLGYTEDYENYYRQAVSNGCDGQKIKQLIKDLDPCL